MRRARRVCALADDVAGVEPAAARGWPLRALVALLRATTSPTTTPMLQSLTEMPRKAMLVAQLVTAQQTRTPVAARAGERVACH